VAWLKRFGLHLAAAIGATGIFVAAAAVGANQTREQVATVVPVPVAAEAERIRTPLLQRKPSVSVATPAASPVPDTAAPGRTQRVVPERSLAGTITAVLADAIVVEGPAGREWRVAPAAGALIRLNGKAAKLDALHAGDVVVILGQAQAGQGSGTRFVAHAITARRK
jgi:hypothetical protein